MSKYTEILQKYWGYTHFRPLQEEIIQSVDNGNDTLALLPTGGGKSITFQLPAMLKEGLCIVITPLIALMKDQVENLQQKGIKAVAIYSGLSKREIEIAYDNCAFGGTKFLYISPERLGTESFINHLQQLKICLIAVDEAHCISQWGYDFRPSYLRIANIRQHLPNIPVLAVTATATPVVVDDIQNKLLFKNKNVKQKSFERKNLTYIVRKVDDKLGYLLKIIHKTPGTGVVYVRNRQKTKEIANFLLQNRISADFYHAGLENNVRDQKQSAWKTGKCRVMVSTNAFGMGIDKADVRFVVHVDIPDSLEAYFQEAGRAGRDEKRAYAVLLYSDTDIKDLEKRVKTTFPEIDTIKNIYNALGNYFQIPIGGAKGQTFDFHLFDFCKRYNQQAVVVFNSLRILQNEGYIEFNEELFVPSRIHFGISRDDLYKFQVSNTKFDAFIKLLLRTYTGLFTDFAPIDEEFLAKRAETTLDVIKQYLIKLDKAKIIDYIPKKKTEYLFFTEERIDPKSLRLSTETYREQKKRYINRVNAVINYTVSDDKCRSKLLLEYFGQKQAPACGECDICRRKNETTLSNAHFEQVSMAIIEKLATPCTQNELINMLLQTFRLKEEKLMYVLRWLIENKKIEVNPHGELFNTHISS